MCSYESYFYAHNDKTEKLSLLSQKLSKLTKKKKKTTKVYRVTPQ